MAVWLDLKLTPSIGTKGHEAKWSSTKHKVVGKPTGNEYGIPSVAVKCRKPKSFYEARIVQSMVILV